MIFGYLSSILAAIFVTFLLCKTRWGHSAHGHWNYRSGPALKMAGVQLLCQYWGGLVIDTWFRGASCPLFVRSVWLLASSESALAIVGDSTSSTHPRSAVVLVVSSSVPPTQTTLDGRGMSEPDDLYMTEKQKAYSLPETKVHPPNPRDYLGPGSANII